VKALLKLLPGRLLGLAGNRERTAVDHSAGAVRKTIKVFGVGLSKTGTTTLGKCLELLGYRVLDFDLEALEAFQRGDFGYALEKTKHYDAFEDIPWFMLYEELDALFPDALFILTTRINAARWVESGKAHAARHRDHLHASVATKSFIDFYTARGVDWTDPGEIYTYHNSRVMSYFRDRPGKLLTVCWENGDGWEKLCTFLGVDVPVGVPFPHANAAPTGIELERSRALHAIRSSSASSY
jgi:hypothetical protein